jgi:hypothetical protein
MISPDRSAVAQLRRRVRAAVKASRALSQDKKRLRRQRRLSPGVMRALFALGGPPFLLSGLLSNGSVQRAADLFLLWILGVTMIRSQQIITLLSQPGALLVPYTLPLSDDAVFAAHQKAVVRTSLWLAMDCAVFGGLVAVWVPTSPAGWVALPLLVLAHGVVALATAGLLALWRRPFPAAIGCIAAPFIGVLLVLFAGKFGHLDTYLEPVLRALRTLTPAGWVQTAFLQAVTASSWVAVGAIVILGAVAGGALPAIAGGLRRRFDLDAVFAAGFGNVNADVDQEASDAAADRPSATDAARARAPAEAPAITARLRYELEQPPGLAFFHRGFLERWIARLLGERRRVVLDFLQPGGGPWLRGMLIGLGIIVVVRLMQTQIPAGPATVVGGYAVALIGVVTLPLFGGRWLGLGALQLERTHVALPAFFPLGFGQIAATVLAINVLRIAATLPLFTIAAMFCLTPAPLPILTGLDYAWRGLGVIAAVQPLLVLFQFSQHTSDSSSRWWRMLVIVLLLIVVVLFGVGLATSAMMVDSPLAALACIATLAAQSLGLLAFYGLAWSRLWFDLAKVPRH